uniref:Uncharacterized protein n=1 Tax=Myoviridae sp. cteo515 TaxID=2823550 RepID=A0A8S5LBG4_9CAUD|nr:MAG TPA: hypothetical protein [Myoviridae sp. cteo515]
MLGRYHRNLILYFSFLPPTLFLIFVTFFYFFHISTPFL